MAKGRRNSQKKRKNSKPNGEVHDESSAEDVKRCPHISRSVKLPNLQNKIPHTTLGQCLDCGELDSSEGLGVCICLCCAHQGCDRNSEEKHALSHNNSNSSHNIVVHLQNWVVWCYACDDEVPVEPETPVHNCIKLILKAMNLSPPPELQVCLSSADKPSNDKPKKSATKNSSQLRSQIKGLANLGNTCFFNAVMQNLCQTELLYVAASCSGQEGFSQDMTSKNKELPLLTVTVQEGPGSVTKALCKLLKEFRSSNSSTLNPRQLFGEICKTATRFKGFRQQDSQELLRYLLDSIRNEEIKRIEAAILKSFGVTSADDANSLDDNKKSHVKEYGASAQAPLIDSVFAGRLVSIVICRQCHKEFKVEETFLDLSLPLTAPEQELWGNRFFGRGGRENPKSAKNAERNNESTVTKDNEVGTEPKGKSLSKHQLKIARKAERKKVKKGKGHGKAGKGKPTEDTTNNKQEGNDHEETEEGELGLEGHELDQMNVSDLDGSDDEQEQVSNTDKNTEELLDTRRDSNEMPGSNEHEESGEQIMQCDDEEPNRLESPGSSYDVKPGRTDELDFTPSRKDSQVAGATESPKCLDEIIDKKNIANLHENDQENENETLDTETEVPSVDMIDDEDKNTISSHLSPECLQGNADKTEERELSPTAFVERLTTENTEYAKQEEEVRLVDNEPDIKQDNDDNQCLSPSENEIVEGMDQLTVNMSIKRDNEDFHTEGVSNDVSKKDGTSQDGERDSLAVKDENVSSADIPSNDGTFQDGERDSLAVKDENITSANDIPGDNSEGLTTTVNEPTSVAVKSSSNELGEHLLETKTSENVTDHVTADQDSTIDSKISANEQNVSDFVHKRENEAEEKTELNEHISNEPETDSEEEHEYDSEANSTLTFQPSYHPSPGECSVMSCLSQFCAPELLDGNNKFACEECSKRAQRSKNKKGSNVNGNEGSADDKYSDSDDDECKGAKAAKKKETKQQTVYTVATKQLLISLAPPVLTLHLKRFQQARFTLRKLTKQVEFPLQLNLAPFCSRNGKSRADSEGQVLYSLYGVVQHSGNMNSGHYTAYVKVSEPPAKGLFDKITNMKDLTDFVSNMWTTDAHKKQRNSRTFHEPASAGQWFHVSDSSVSTVPETKVLKCQAYMLFYGRLPLGSR